MDKINQDNTRVIEIFSGTMWEAELTHSLLTDAGIQSFVRNTVITSYLYDPIQASGVKVDTPTKKTSPRRAFLPPPAGPGDQWLPASFDHLYHSRYLASNFTLIQGYPTRQGLVNFIRRGLINISVSST